MTATSRNLYLLSVGRFNEGKIEENSRLLREMKGCHFSDYD